MQGRWTLSGTGGSGVPGPSAVAAGPPLTAPCLTEPYRSPPSHFGDILSRAGQGAASLSAEVKGWAPSHLYLIDVHAGVHPREHPDGCLATQVLRKDVPSATAPFHSGRQEDRVLATGRTPDREVVPPAVSATAVLCRLRRVSGPHEEDRSVANPGHGGRSVAASIERVAQLDATAAPANLTRQRLIFEPRRHPPVLMCSVVQGLQCFWMLDRCSRVPGEGR